MSKIFDAITKEFDRRGLLYDTHDIIGDASMITVPVRFDDKYDLEIDYVTSDDGAMLSIIVYKIGPYFNERKKPTMYKLCNKANSESNFYKFYVKGDKDFCFVGAEYDVLFPVLLSEVGATAFYAYVDLLDTIEMLFPLI